MQTSNFKFQTSDKLQTSKFKGLIFDVCFLIFERPKGAF